MASMISARSSRISSCRSSMRALTLALTSSMRALTLALTSSMRALTLVFWLDQQGGQHQQQGGESDSGADDTPDDRPRIAGRAGGQRLGHLGVAHVHSVAPFLRTPGAASPPFQHLQHLPGAEHAIALRVVRRRDMRSFVVSLSTAGVAAGFWQASLRGVSGLGALASAGCRRRGIRRASATPACGSRRRWRPGGLRASTPS